MLCNSANIDRNNDNDDQNDYEDYEEYWDNVDIEDLDVHLEESNPFGSSEETGDDRFFFCKGLKSRIICTGLCVSTKKTF